MLRRHQFASLLVVSLAAASPTRTTAQTIPGWTLTMNITTDSGSGRRSSTAMKQQVTDDMFRWEIVQSSGMAMPVSVEGMYMIIKSSDSTMTSVMPSQHMATVMSMNPMKDMPTPRMKAVQHLTRSDLEDLGDGGRILGHATRHYRLTTAGTMDITMMGTTCSQRLDAVAEMWITPDVDLGAMTAAFQKQMGGFGGVDPSDLSGHDGVAPAAMPKGMSLKTVTTRKGRAPGAPDVTMTLDIVELSHGPIDASTFAVPQDMRTMDMRQMMSMLPAGMLDSAMKEGASAGSDIVRKSMCGG